MQKTGLILLIFISILFQACTNSSEKKETDTLSTGTIKISADESFRDIVEDQIKVFDSAFPDANIIVSYKPEAECLKDFMNDSVRMILVTRELNTQERQVLEQKKVVPTAQPLAKDAVAVIVNKGSADTVFSVSELRGILTGKHKKKFTVVFDNQGSSTLRYMLDSLIPGEQLAANVFAAKGEDSLIRYVANNPDAIGLLGVSAVSDFSDPNGLAFIGSIRVADIFNDKLGKTFGPYQAYIAPNWYPLTRNLYYIHRETYPGLGTGFANFMSRERGQLIFKQARLFPLKSNIIFREAAVNP
ncbi:MAG: phosphate ABC transporter substrate-binding protein, PhoT family [Chitinophagaceae bacterium]|nr:MAG: phosphate ABC transporter substrate-binding protein, PhoT family [Chitinophagaceae bacterium]